MEIHKALDGGFDDFGERDPVRFRYFTENSRVGETWSPGHTGEGSVL